MSGIKVNTATQMFGSGCVQYNEVTKADNYPLKYPHGDHNGLYCQPDVAFSKDPL